MVFRFPGAPPLPGSVKAVFVDICNNLKIKVFIVNIKNKVCGKNWSLNLRRFSARRGIWGDNLLHVLLLRRHRILGIILAAVLLAALAAGPGNGRGISAAAPEKAEKKVLLLYPRSMDFPFYAGFTASFKQCLHADPSLDIRYYHENLEVLAYSMDEPIARAVAEVLRQKYRNDRPDIIVVHSLISIKFLDQYCRDIFGDTPVVVYNTRPVEIDPALRRANYTFCHPALEPARNAALILDLLPSVRRLYVIVDKSAGEWKVYRELPHHLSPLAVRVEITYLTASAQGELLERVSAIAGPDAAILFVDFVREADGTALVPASVVRAVAAAASVPVFGSYSTHIGDDGAIGGYVLNMDNLGRKVGARALAILQGRAAPGAIEELSVGEYRFAWAGLERWRLDADQLPPGSILLNRPTAFWRTYCLPIAGAVFFAVLVFIFQAALIAGQRARRRSAEYRAALGAELIAEQREVIVERTSELHDSEDRFRKIFRHSPAMIAIRSMADGRYVEVNRKFLDILEYSREEVIGHTPAELGLRADPDDRQADEMADDLRRAGEMPSREVKLRTKSGRLVVVIATVTLIPIGADQCRIAIMQDLTREKALEADLLRLDRLNLVGEMAAGIGHEVRNPMTTVRGYLQMFRRKEKFRAHYGQIDTMIEELDRANAIISEFLSLAKTKVADLRPGDLGASLAAILPLLKADALCFGCALELKNGPIPAILFDEKELRQLVLNLVRNALEATPAGGMVTIATRHESGKVLLVVQDTGRGIPPAVADKIGTPFLTTKENGTGLGLSVCYRIAQRHGAAITFTTGNNGTAFFIVFPPAP